MSAISCIGKLRGRETAISRGRKGCLLAAIGAAGFLATASEAQAPSKQFMEAVTEMTAGREIRADANSEPMVRILAAASNPVIADTRAFQEELAASGFLQIFTMEQLTPASPVLDHCDRISALGERAVAIGRKYPTYVAAARRQGEIEVASHNLTPSDVAGFIDGFAEKQTGFERMMQIYAAMAPDDASLCEVLAKRHWKVAADGETQFTDDGDRTQAVALATKLQGHLDEMNARREAAQTEVQKNLHQ
jgi:hypothetical protein